MEALRFAFLTDLHYYSPALGTHGAAYELENMKNQKLLKDSGKVIAAAFEQLAADTDTQIILINGDLTNNGEYESHREIIALLRALRQTGKRIFVTTSTHDYQNDGTTFCYTGEEKTKIPAAVREELFEMYREFGPDQAIALHRDSMSYVAQLADGYRLLALNDDRNLSGKSGYSEELFAWITAQIQDAHANGQILIPMTHHPLIAPSVFYAIIGKNDMMGDHELRMPQFAERGIGWMFTGHSHIHNISYQTAPNDTVFFDISTTALAGFPGGYRVVTIDPSAQIMRIRSVNVEGFDELLNDQLFGMVRRVINAAATDVDELAHEAEAFSIRSHVTYRYGWLIRPAAKLLRKLKISTVHHLCKKESGLTAEEAASLRDQKVMDLIITMAMNLYGGDGSYTPDTPTYKVTMGFLSVIDSFLRTIHQPVGKFLKGTPSLQTMIEPLLYKKGIADADADIPLHPTTADIQQYEVPAGDIQSRKGIGVLAILLLLCLVLLPFLPLLIPAFGIGFLVNEIRYHDKIHPKED